MVFNATFNNNTSLIKNKKIGDANIVGIISQKEEKEKEVNLILTPQ
jgi:hypothetical protein